MKRAPIDIARHKVPKGRVVVLKDKCKGCQLCVAYCPREVLETSQEYNAKAYHFPKIKAGKEGDCVACNFCEMICPDFAIFVQEESRPARMEDLK